MFAKIQSAAKGRLFQSLIFVCIVSLISLPFYAELKNKIASSRIQLDMYKSSLEIEISRYKFLPFVLSQNEKFLDILSGRMTPLDSGYFLQRTKYATNVSTIYVLDRAGTAVAASNWYRPDNYLGMNFSHRPYFQDAMAGRLGQFYGMGLKTMTPGFYLAYGLRSGEDIAGAVVIEINLADLEEVWRAGPDEILVHDVNDNIFLSSNKDWKYKLLRRGNDVTADREGRYLEEEAISLLSMPRCYRVGDLTFYRDDDWGCVFPTLMSTEEKIIEYSWTILSLQSTRYFYTSAGLVFVISILLYLILVFAYRILKNRFSKRIQKLRNQLVENSKLAAIGQMATEVAHEFNQPLAAIYMLLDTTRLLLQKQRYPEADENLTLISSHIERLTQQMSQMKSFASRHRVPQGDADIVAVANSSIKLFRVTLRKQDIKLTFRTNAPEIHVPCNEIGLEQIFSNLISNALEAMAHQKVRMLDISIERDAGNVRVTVRDNGPGIPDLARIFDSFFSTKQRGTGLGLAIVNGIVEHSGGSISARNHPERGAEFTLNWRELRKGDPS
ncbi:ATP-binding protein [uncultured Cohaesibacter sp.]|uniref:ATP-binding protein n=1 Tax=uncultured Cohaesibacter sp. TaxID=1002546 RepID=UPI0029C6DCE8|nr:ATP-binding protein [uncultured Cohaesibacter sp.]